MPKLKTVLVVAIVTLAAGGCRDDENRRLAEMAERSLERQAQQEIRNTELQRHIAEGTKRLVESDAAAREDMIGPHRDVQLERSELGRQRDLLEHDRRDVANSRNRAPVIAEAIKAVGLMFACAVPLLIAWQVLRRSDQADENMAIAELLLAEINSPTPKLFTIHDRTDRDRSKELPRIGDRPTGQSDRN